MTDEIPQIPTKTAETDVSLSKDPQKVRNHVDEAEERFHIDEAFDEEVEIEW